MFEDPVIRGQSIYACDPKHSLLHSTQLSCIPLSRCRVQGKGGRVALGMRAAPKTCSRQSQQRRAGYHRGTRPFYVDTKFTVGIRIKALNLKRGL